MQIGPLTPHSMQSSAPGGGVESDGAHARAAHTAIAARRVAALAEVADPALSAGTGDGGESGAVTPLAYTAAGRIREAAVRPRVSIVA